MCLCWFFSSFICSAWGTSSHIVHYTGRWRHYSTLHWSLKTLTLKVLNFWKFTSYCSLKHLWSGMGEVVPARTSPTLHPPSSSHCESIVATSTVRVNILQVTYCVNQCITTVHPPMCLSWFLSSSFWSACGPTVSQEYIYTFATHEIWLKNCSILFKPIHTSSHVFELVP